MAVNGLTDICSTVTVPKTEYERLVRESEKSKAVVRYISGSKNWNIDTIKMILDIVEEGEK